MGTALGTPLAASVAPADARKSAMIRVGFAMAGHQVPQIADDLSAAIHCGEMTLAQAKAAAFAALDPR